MVKVAWSSPDTIEYSSVEQGSASVAMTEPITEPAEPPSTVKTVRTDRPNVGVAVLSSLTVISTIVEAVKAKPNTGWSVAITMNE